MSRGRAYIRTATVAAAIGVGITTAVLVPWSSTGPEPYPTSFRTAWDPTFRVWRDGPRSYRANLTASSLMVTTTHGPYYVSPTGSDAANGLSPATARRSLRSMLGAIAGPATIYVTAGTYDWTFGWHNVNPPHDANVIAVGGRMRSTIAELNLTWSNVGGSEPNTWSATAVVGQTIYAVIDETDPTADGLGSRLAVQASVAAVEANPGSYRVDSGTLYVRTHDSRQPDASLHPMVNFVNGTVTTATRRLFVEGVDFLGGAAAFSASDGDRLVFHDCTFRYANTVGLTISSANDAYVLSSAADENTADGFSYTTTPHVLEVDATARANGHNGADINNGSTSHSGASVIRIGGTYRNNEGPNIADVNETRSLNYAVTASGTKAATAAQRVNLYCDGLCWCRECVLDSAGVTDDIVAEDADDRVSPLNSQYSSTGGLGAVYGWAP